MEASGTPDLTPEQVDAMVARRAYVRLLLVVSLAGLVVSLGAWCFLEGSFQVQQELYVHLPHAFGYDNTPTWWVLPVLALGALLVALAIRYLPGDGGHIPAKGLAAGVSGGPKVLPGIVAAGFLTIGSGLVLGPEGPLIPLGAGLAAILVKIARRDTPPSALMVVGAAGSFAAVSFIFSSPLIAAILMIEATGLGGPRLRVILVPGLLCAGIGSLVSLGIGGFTGVSTSDYALGALPLAKLTSLQPAQFGWTILLSAVIAIVVAVIMRGGLATHKFVAGPRIVAWLPVVGLIIAGLAILFDQVTSKGQDEVLFSGQDQLTGLVMHAPGWSLGTLALLIGCKGIAYLLSLGSFRGGPTFPALFLGAVAGIMATHLPNFPESAAVAVGMGAGVVAVLRLPLSAVAIATLLTVNAGSKVEPLIISGVVTSYVVTILLSRPGKNEAAELTGDEAPGAQPATAPAA
jgi:H+/Cl- antiporter ClcA